MNLTIICLALQNNKSTSNKDIKSNITNLPRLFALSKRGQIRTYEISVEDKGDKAILTTAKRVTLSGKWTYDKYVFTHGVNIGKANETTYLQQALNEADSIFNKLLDSGFSTSLPDASQKFNTDADGSMKPMLAIGFSPKKIQFPCIVQPKYDGVRCLVFEENGSIQIKSRKGKPYNIPHLYEWATKHRDLLPLDGELYNHGDLTFQEIVSAVKKHSDITSKIRYVVYDRPVDNVTNKERWESLIKDFSSLPTTENSPVYLSESSVCNDLDSIKKYHDDCVSKGYEGAIIRNENGMYEFGFRSNNLIKIKYFKDSEYKIVDVLEANGRDAGTAIFVCECPAGIFNVKPMGNRKLRSDYLRDRQNLIGKMVTVKYQELSDDGIPRFPTAISVRDYE